MINRSSLYYIASVIWGIPGVIITVKGVSAYFAADKSQLWWLMLITALVLTGFIFMFRRIVAKYCRFIQEHRACGKRRHEGAANQNFSGYAYMWHS